MAGQPDSWAEALELWAAEALELWAADGLPQVDGKSTKNMSFD